MKITKTELDGVLLLEPKVFNDPRGYFFESYTRKSLKEHGVDVEFVQDNQSYSSRGVLRGLHYQMNRMQAKLIRVIQGEIFDVAVDVRRGSPNFGKWVGKVLSGENFLQLYIPAGFAHGFCVLSDTVLATYKCSDYYSPEDERGLIWNAPDVGIEWPIKDPLLSEKDLVFGALNELEDLPEYK